MADAHGTLSPIDEGKVRGDMVAKPTALLPVSLEEETSPTMPHLDYTPEELDQIHPSIEAPSEEELLDFSDDRTDGVFQKGLRIAAEISRESRAQGRRRRPEAEASREEPEGRGKAEGRTTTAACTPTLALSAATTTARASCTSASSATTARPPETAPRLLRSASVADSRCAQSEEECLALPPSRACSVPFTCSTFLAQAQLVRDTTERFASTP